MEARRRVLVLAYFFPPLGGAGVQRTLKFVRYLEPLRWDATVITTSSRAYTARDPSLLDEIPAATRVIRVRSFPLLGWIGAIAGRLGQRWLRDWALWPDGGKGWAPFAFFAALREIRRERPDVIFSTSAPYGAHLAAMRAARRTGIPWVADFRDEWAWNPYSADRTILSALTRRVERAVTTTAQHVVVAADYFRLEGPEPDDRRRTVILNGVDEDDLPEVGLPEPTTNFVLAHIGTVYEGFDPTPVLRVLADLIERGEVDGKRVEVRFTGSIWIEGFQPPPVIRFDRTGYVDHAKAVAEMRSATALLLYRPSSSLAPSGKLFEYLASGRPLLCVVRPDNLASRIVRDWDAGVVADPANEAEIEEAILTLWRRWTADGLPDQLEVRRRTLQEYSRPAGAAQLAAVLEEATYG
ncbi:MAG TPA: glycosyltransferase [Gaiellaceae bacterium]|nr:glycosyltransferase [Gaiellaceae bacterium]